MAQSRVTGLVSDIGAKGMTKYCIEEEGRRKQARWDNSDNRPPGRQAAHNVNIVSRGVRDHRMEQIKREMKG
jgi:hypothetical protein